MMSNHDERLSPPICTAAIMLLSVAAWVVVILACAGVIKFASLLGGAS